MYFVILFVCLQPLISLEPTLRFCWNLAHRVFRVSEPHPTTFNNMRVLYYHPLPMYFVVVHVEIKLAKGRIGSWMLFKLNFRFLHHRNTEVGRFAHVGNECYVVLYHYNNKTYEGHRTPGSDFQWRRNWLAISLALYSTLLLRLWWLHCESTSHRWRNLPLDNHTMQPWTLDQAVVFLTTGENLTLTAAPDWCIG